MDLAPQVVLRQWLHWENGWPLQRPVSCSATDKCSGICISLFVFMRLWAVINMCATLSSRTLILGFFLGPLVPSTAPSPLTQTVRLLVQETGQVHLRRPSVRSMCVHWVLTACSGNVSRSVCVCVRAWSARVGARRCVTYRSLSCCCADEYDVAEN
jgi:hypothetical protein